MTNFIQSRTALTLLSLIVGVVLGFYGFHRGEVTVTPTPTPSATTCVTPTVTPTETPTASPEATVAPLKTTATATPKPATT